MSPLPRLRHRLRARCEATGAAGRAGSSLTRYHGPPRDSNRRESLVRSQLGQSIRRERKKRKLTVPALARRVRDSERWARAKGARRIQTLEDSGLEEPDFVRAVAEALGIAEQTVGALAEADEAQRRREWERWADEPIRPFMVVRYGSHWFLHLHRELPAGIRSLEQAEEHVGRFVRAERDRLGRAISARLVFSRRIHVSFDETGQPIKRHEQSYRGQTPLPAGNVDGKHFLFGGEKAEGRVKIDPG